MVAAGFTGVNDVFSGAQNFFITFGQDPDPALLVDGFGERYEILETTIRNGRSDPRSSRCWMPSVS